MNYKLGINSKGKKYQSPLVREICNKLESYCNICNKWIVICSVSGKKYVTYAWYKHFQKIIHNNFFYFMLYIKNNT